MIRVILVDDHEMVLEGFASLLRGEPNIEVVGVYSKGDEVIELVQSTCPDVALLDIELSDELNGIDLAKILLKTCPDVKVLMLSMYKTHQFIEQVFQAGIHGYIVKENGPDELVKAITTIAGGKNYYSNEVTDVVMDNLRNPRKLEEKKEFSIPLTKREKEVLALIVDGLTSNQIGEQLFIATSTVESHRRNLIDKTGVKNSKELIAFAVKTGLS